MFVFTFFVLCFICLLLHFYTRARLSVNDNSDFRSFQRTYLSVYLLAVGKKPVYDFLSDLALTSEDFCSRRLATRPARLRFVRKLFIIQTRYRIIIRRWIWVQRFIWNIHRICGR